MPVFCLDDPDTKPLVSWLSGHSSPWAGARAYARKHGRSVVMRSDDAAVVIERYPDGRLKQKTFKPTEVQWTWAGKHGPVP